MNFTCRNKLLAVLGEKSVKSVWTTFSVNKLKLVATKYNGHNV